jgi:hypothetical protein
MERKTRRSIENSDWKREYSKELRFCFVGIEFANSANRKLCHRSGGSSTRSSSRNSPDGQRHSFIQRVRFHGHGVVQTGGIGEAHTAVRRSHTSRNCNAMRIVFASLAATTIAGLEGFVPR